jgi:hypothetical protein
MCINKSTVSKILQFLVKIHGSFVGCNQIWYWGTRDNTFRWLTSTLKNYNIQFFHQHKIIIEEQAQKEKIPDSI